jgi:hypothetical protein
LSSFSDDILVVSGLPRSGTSLLMQMLQAGGVPILTDSVRAADLDNPKGYFEFEATKKLLEDQSWLAHARGKAVKIVVPLVCSLPPGFRYRVLLIERNYTELLDSQAKMIQRRAIQRGGKDLPNSPERRELLTREFARAMDRAKTLLGSREDVQLLVLRHEDIMGDPEAAARFLADFAGGTLDRACMAATVDRSLHRNRRA